MFRPRVATLSLTLTLLTTSSATAGGPVQVFILAGQSNMEGKAAVSTLEAVIRDEATRKRFHHLQSGDEWTIRDDVFVTYLDRDESPVSPRFGRLTVGFGSPKNSRDDDNKRIRVPGVGPELGIGWVLGEAIDEPVLLIKTAWGGRALKHTFRPPSAMPSDEQIRSRLAEVQKKNAEMTFAELKESYGRDYRKIVSEVSRVLNDIDRYVPEYDESASYELAGCIWFQGWNDGVGGGNPDYTAQLAHFIRDIRSDLSAPGLPFVIGEFGIDGAAATGWVAGFREQQVAVTEIEEFRGNVKLAPTAHLWPNPPDLTAEWQEFRAAAQANEQKSTDDPTRINPGEFYNTNWRLKFRDQLSYTSDKRYHYLGSGACYYQMGESMGQAMLELLDAKQ